MEAHNNADAGIWLEGVAQQQKRNNGLLREFIGDVNKRLQEAANEDEADNIIEHCRNLERLLGAIEVYLSPYRSDSPLAQSGRQLELFNGQEEGR